MTRVFSLVFRLLPAIVSLAVPLGAQAKGFTLAQIRGLVDSRVPEDRILTFARQRCLGFALGPREATQLRQAGASPQLVRELESVCTRIPAGRVTSPPTSAARPSVDALIRRGDERRGWADYTGALSDYRRAIEIDPSNARAHDGLGQTLLFLDRDSLARRAFARAVELRPAVSDYHVHLAGALNRLGGYSEAEMHAREAVRLNQGGAEGYFQRGMALEGLGRLNEAMQALQVAVRIAPEIPLYGYSLDQMERRADSMAISKHAYDIPELSGYIAFVGFNAFGPTVNRLSTGGSGYRFAHDSVRLVGYNVEVSHPVMSRRTDYELVAVIYRPEGGEWFRDTLVSHVLPTTTISSERGRNRGYDIPGQWSAGTYRVDFLHRGERVASSAFEIVDTAAAVSVFADSERVVAVRFFEAGTSQPNEYQRRYRYRFPTSTTRFIHVVVDIGFPERQRPVGSPLQIIYYAPDGHVLGTSDVANANSSFNGGRSSHVSLGFGYTELGKWVAGRHRVDVMSGSQRIASGWFDIY